MLNKPDHSFMRLALEFVTYLQANWYSLRASVIVNRHVPCTSAFMKCAVASCSIRGCFDAVIQTLWDKTGSSYCHGFLFIAEIKKFRGLVDELVRALVGRGE